MACMKTQIKRLRENKCVECGKKMPKDIYEHYPTLCRTCARKKMRKN